MKVIGELPFQETLHQSLVSGRRGAEINGHRYSVERLRAFAVHGCTCVRCGRSGDRIIAWVAHDGVMHVDLFTKNYRGEPIMMTRDHIIPKSKQGPNDIFNYQPMCFHCNVHKGNKESPRDRRTAEFRAHWRQVHQTVSRWVRPWLHRPLVLHARNLYLYKLTWLWARITA